MEILLWKQIDSHSWLWPFSQFNLASALDVGHYFAAYENLNFFGWPVNHMFVIGVMSVGSIMICMLWTARRFCTEQTSGAGKMLGFYRKSKKQSVSRTYTNGFRTYTSGSGAHTIDSEVHTSGCGIHAIGWRIHTNLWRHETFKLLITGKGLLLLILLGALQFGSYYDRTYYTTAEEYEYHTYSESLEGKLYWRKEIFLKEEKERFAENEQQLADLYAQYEAGEISLAALEQYENRLKISDAKKAALEQTVTQYITLLEYEEKGENVEYIEQTGWDKLLGTNGRHERLGNAGKLLLFLSMAVLVYTLMDDASGVNVLQRISAVGSRALMWRKLAVCGGYAFALAALAFWPQILSVWHRFGMTLPNVSAHSILALSGIPVALPLRIWFLFFLFGKPAGAAVYAWLLLLGVERMRKIIKKY